VDRKTGFFSSFLRRFAVCVCGWGVLECLCFVTAQCIVVFHARPVVGTGFHPAAAAATIIFDDLIDLCVVFVFVSFFIEKWSHRFLLQDRFYKFIHIFIGFLNSQEEGKSKESPKRFLYLTSEIL
jgi:hypothetical protein